MFCWLFCFNLQCSCRKMFQKNDFSPNGVAHTPFGEKSFFWNILRQLHCKLKQKSQQNKSEISDLFCKRFLFQLECILLYINIGNFRYISKISDLFRQRFLFQLRVHSVVYMSEISDIYRKFTMYFVDFFVPTLECILSYIHTSDKFYCK